MSDDQAPLPVAPPPIDMWKDKFRRWGHSTWACITELGRGGWLVNLLVSSVSLAFTIANYNIQSRDEDMRVTIRGGSQTLNRVSLVFHFINLGKQSASIEEIDLLEVDTSYSGDNYQDIILSCDGINSTTRLVLGSPVGQIMGRGSRVGDDKKQTGVFAASKRVVEGTEIASKTPIFVDAGKEKVVSVDFEISGFDDKKFNTMVMCPSFAMLDKTGKIRLAICKGYLRSVTGTRFQQYEVHQLWRLLPRGEGTQCTE
jgi:hypothetical protein